MNAASKATLDCFFVYKLKDIEDLINILAFVNFLTRLGRDRARRTERFCSRYGSIFVKCSLLSFFLCLTHDAFTCCITLDVVFLLHQVNEMVRVHVWSKRLNCIYKQGLFFIFTKFMINANIGFEIIIVLVHKASHLSSRMRLRLVFHSSILILFQLTHE